jgi:BED zinc finger
LADAAAACIDEAVAAAVEEAAAANDDPSSRPAVTSKGKRKTSGVWQHFTQLKVEDKKGQMVIMNQCNYCSKMYKAVIGGPTSTLQRHLQSCGWFKRSKGKRQGLIRFESCESGTVLELNTNRGYDQMKYREIMAKMIIAHELPFVFVEYTWFNILMKYNNLFLSKSE